MIMTGNEDCIMKKVYFAGSIRGGREDTSLYNEIISYINKTDIVMTEFVGDIEYSAEPGTLSHEQAIYTKDTTMLKDADLVIAECTRPSHGVGYELCYAERYEKPVYIIYRPGDHKLSAMLTGNPYFSVYTYNTREELFAILKLILDQADC